MYPRLDAKLLDRLRCPLCKATLRNGTRQLTCDACGTPYPLRAAAKGAGAVYDMRIRRPDYCAPNAEGWGRIQSAYESASLEVEERDPLDEYTAGLESVREIYQDEFDLRGDVIDIGGHLGTLREFLRPDDRARYISVDPFLEVFARLPMNHNLLTVYPSLREPCNFVSCHAEFLPFVERSFDWVHMRSVLDHFADPYLAMREAHRVLREDGHLLIGLAVSGGGSSINTSDSPTSTAISLARRVRVKLRDAGLRGIATALARRAKGHAEHHTFHWTYDNLIDLLSRTGFRPIKEHWQKPPYTMVVYIAAERAAAEAGAPEQSG